MPLCKPCKTLPGARNGMILTNISCQSCRLSAPVVAMAKEAVNSANDLGLSEGVKKESLLFSACFGLYDQKEGMTAFLEKRKPRFEDR